jgi:hypothetical protein
MKKRAMISGGRENSGVKSEELASWQVYPAGQS